MLEDRCRNEKPFRYFGQPKSVSATDADRSRRSPEVGDERIDQGKSDEVDVVDVVVAFREPAREVDGAAVAADGDARIRPVDLGVRDRYSDSR